MYTTYCLNAGALTPGSLDALKTLFGNKTIEISVCDTEEIEQDETAYLLANPVNRARLQEAMENVANRKNLVSVDLSDIAHESRL
uniref:Antitoxin YefM n=1 Tax=Candidatus Kentrum sp. LPFa TaxID=2126335 RepID=A0A450XP12_9GAMM|nr:MAG: antitoxin YefM [Candidatus Kentron sp. LPFa]VFK31062.1 MAG: antitoxin YefM [Candidatus Kentron sp. LPFa]